MKKTVVLLEINHDKSLPTSLDVSDVVSQRLYGWLLNAGLDAEVTAKTLGTFEGAQ